MLYINNDCPVVQMQCPCKRRAQFNEKQDGQYLKYPITVTVLYTNTIQFDTMLIQCYSFAMSMLWEQLRKTSAITSLELDLAVGALSTMSHKAQRFTAIPMPVYVT